MTTNDDRQPTPSLTDVIIPKENAVFWMDDRGRWHNRHGRFEHKRIIDHFNRAIRRDDAGYYVTQVRGGIREKVYFPFEDTPLFVKRIIPTTPLQLLLNTGEKLPLDPASLFVHADHVYLQRADERVKFSERALLALAPYLEEDGNGLILRIDECVWSIPERSTQQ